MNDTASKRAFLLFHNGGIGDFLMFVFLSEQLWKSGKASRIVIVVPRMSLFLADLAKSYAYIEVVELSKKRLTNLRKIIPFACTQTTVVLPPTLGKIPLQVKLFAWACTRFRGSALSGFQDAGPLWKTLYTRVYVYDTTENYADLMRDFAERESGYRDDSPPRLAHTPRAGVLEYRHLSQGSYVLFHPGAGISLRQRAFSPEESTAIVHFLLEKHPHLQVVLSGSAEERELVARIVENVRGEKVVPVVGVSASELATLIQNAVLYIGGDTGITHLACFLGTRVLEIAHNGAPHWLCYYAPQALVLYRFQGDREAHSDLLYLSQHVQGRRYPLDRVPLEAVFPVLKRLL